MKRVIRFSDLFVSPHVPTGSPFLGGSFLLSDFAKVKVDLAKFIIKF